MFYLFLPIDIRNMSFHGPRLARAEAQRVHGAAKESHNERTRNTLKHSTCSHKWWRHRKISIFGVKPAIPALRGSRECVVASAEKTPLLCYQFHSKQYLEQFVTPWHCSPQSRCNSLAFRTTVILRLLLDLDCYGMLILWVCFLHF